MPAPIIGAAAARNGKNDEHDFCSKYRRTFMNVIIRNDLLSLEPNM